MAASSSTGPMYVLNIRLKRRGAESFPPSAGQVSFRRSTISGSLMSVCVSSSVPGSSSSR